MKRPAFFVFFLLLASLCHTQTALPVPELEAIYSIRTDYGVTIHIRNVGLLCNNKDGWYFPTAPKFEAPNDGKYDWVNNAVFICVPEGKEGYISLKVWKVK